MIGLFGINRCPVLDNFGKKGAWVVLAVFGAWNDLFWLPGEPREFGKKLCRFARRAVLRLNAHQQWDSLLEERPSQMSYRSLSYIYDLRTEQG